MWSGLGETSLVWWEGGIEIDRLTMFPGYIQWLVLRK